MIRADDVHALTDFQRRTKDHIRRLRRSGRPAILTVNGKASVIVQDAEAYQRLLEDLDRAEAVAGIRRGLVAADRGRGTPAGEALDKIRRKRRIPREA